MSNALAIAATTASLRALLERFNPLAIEVTTLPPDQAHKNVTKDRINLFLYQAAMSAAWRNADVPRQLKPGESGYPPLPLSLSYLLTAYSDKSETQSQQALGQAMSVLHDHPLLDAAFIEDATATEVPGSDLHQQVERVRITLQPEPLEELSKLWTAFQTHYRTSVAYQVSVVLIESARAAKTPLPVLQRGEDDKGVSSQPDLESPFPTLLAVALPARQQSARLGDTVTLSGLHLDAGVPKVLVRHPRLAAPSPVILLPGASATEIRFQLVDDPALWAAGLYTVAVELTRPGELRTTNELPLTLAPRLFVPPDVVRNPPPPGESERSADIEVKISPQLHPGQRAALLVGDREVPLGPPLPALPTDALTFVVQKAQRGTFLLRLRIDGVDSIPLDLAAATPKFAADQQVHIHD